MQGKHAPLRSLTYIKQFLHCPGQVHTPPSDSHRVYCGKCKTRYFPGVAAFSPTGVIHRANRGCNHGYVQNSKRNVTRESWRACDSQWKRGFIPCTGAHERLHRPKMNSSLHVNEKSFSTHVRRNHVHHISDSFFGAQYKKICAGREHLEFTSEPHTGCTVRSPQDHIMWSFCIS